MESEEDMLCMRTGTFCKAKIYLVWGQGWFENGNVLVESDHFPSDYLIWLPYLREHRGSEKLSEKCYHAILCGISIIAFFINIMLLDFLFFTKDKYSELFFWPGCKCSIPMETWKQQLEKQSPHCEGFLFPWPYQVLQDPGKACFGCSQHSRPFLKSPCDRQKQCPCMFLPCFPLINNHGFYRRGGGWI